MTAQIPAEITFEDFRTRQTFTIQGAVPLDQLFDKQTHWITVSNTIQHKSRWISHQFFISKGDIVRIVFLERHSFISFEHGKMFLNNADVFKAKVSQQG